MAYIDEEYHRILETIMNWGYDYEDPNRKGVIRKETPSLTLNYSFDYGFPAITTKKVYFKGAVAEILFFLSGSTDIRDLWKRGVNFWNKDVASFHGITEDEFVLYKKAYKLKEDTLEVYNMGKIYPYQYRNFAGQVDQIQNLIDTLRTNPMSTSMIVNAWNPAELNDMCLPPCHWSFQVVGVPLGEDKYGFELHWNQRSVDTFLGLPINILYYALLAKVLELLTGHRALVIQGDLKNVHIYDNQFKVVEEQLTRSPHVYGNSRLEINGIEDDIEFLKTCTIDEFIDYMEVDDFQLKGYTSYPPLNAEMLARDK